jgi:hypothetical protein
MSMSRLNFGRLRSGVAERAGTYRPRTRMPQVVQEAIRRIIPARPSGRKGSASEKAGQQKSYCQVIALIGPFVGRAIRMGGAS